jgi:hypothetical protein
MLSKSRIIKKQPDGTYKSIYIERGAPTYSSPPNEELNSLLLQTYNTPEKIDTLLKLGNIEVLKPTVEESAHYSHKDMKKDCANTYPSYEEALKARKTFTEHTYLFQNNTWYIKLPCTWEINPTDHEKFMPLADFMKNPTKAIKDTWDAEINDTSRIIKQHTNGTYSAIHIHHYGQPYTSEQFLKQHPKEKTVGELLLANYNTPKEIDALLALGDLEKLEATVKNSARQTYEDPKTDNTHTFPTLEKTYLEEEYECPPTVIYTYLFKDNTWHIDDNDGKFVPLTDYVDRIQKKHQEPADKETKEPSIEI